MKILMLTTNSSLMDGINRHILTVAPTVNKYQDCEVAVCTVYPRAELAEALEKEGVRTFALNAANGHDKKIFAAFHKVMRDYNPDIIHSHVMALYEKMLLSTFYRSKQYVRTVHGISDKVVHESFRMKLDRWLNTVFAIRYDATCYVSNGVRQHLSKESYQDCVYTIYNPLHFGEVKSKGVKLHKIINVAEDVPVIGTCCRLAAVKRPELFTKVMCKVLQIKGHAHAVIIGDGDKLLKQELIDIVKKENVAERFHFLGYRQDAPELVRDLNCFVMTSISEGLPTSILEAMASKTPFAMMEGNGGLKDIADLNRKEGPIGIVVPNGDIDAHVNSICKLIDNPDYFQALAVKAFETGRRHFDVESVCSQLYHVYKVVCQQ